MTPLELDEYLDHNDVKINDETLSIAHHGILGMKWGRLNGPPYPLGRGDHSASEKKAASKAGIKVGTDSGKGSIENIKKSGTTVSRSRSSSKSETMGSARDGKESKSVEQTGSTNRQETAQKSKPVDKNELKKRQEAAKKARDTKAAKKEHEEYRQEALWSGDPKRIKEVMKESSYQEIKEALDRVDIYAKVDAKIPPEPSTMDKIDKIVSNANTINNWVTTGTNIWNNFAKIHNAVNQDGSDLPIIGQDNSKNRTAAQKAAARIDRQERELVKNAIKSGDPQKIQSVLSMMNATELNDANTMLKNKEALNMTIKDQSPETKKAREQLNEIIMNGDNTALLDALNSYTSDQLTQAQNRSNTINNLQKSVMVQRARSMQSSGKTYEEIAEALNIPKGSVGNLLFGGSTK